MVKNYCWIVEVKNPLNVNNTLWYANCETLEKVCIKWFKETNNKYLNYYKLHNIFHNRNVSDNLLIKVKKIKAQITEL
tara:strand:+ start:426 stop:659 length:234 start_codon:yes stop_codon:yes gene_type:complete